jgi:hypothetical protein
MFEQTLEALSINLPKFLMDTAYPMVQGAGHSTNDNDAKMYSMITAINEDNTDGTTMNLELYYKDNSSTDERELHGNMIMTTSKVEENSIVSVGFVLTQDDSDYWDGVKISFALNPELNAAQTVFSIQDLYQQGELGDLMADGVSSLPGDTVSADWQIHAHKSKIDCDDNGCSFNIHFMRAFDTTDA